MFRRRLFAIWFLQNTYVTILGTSLAGNPLGKSFDQRRRTSKYCLWSTVKCFSHLVWYM